MTLYSLELALRLKRNSISLLVSRGGGEIKSDMMDNCQLCWILIDF